MENQELEDKHMTFMEAISFALTNNLTTDIQQSSFSSSFKNEKLIKDINEESIDNKTSTDKKTEYQEIKTKFSKKSISLDTNNRTIMSHKLQSSNSMSLRDRYLLRRLKTELRISIDIENDKVDTDKYMYGTLYACIGLYRRYASYSHYWRNT